MMNKVIDTHVHIWDFKQAEYQWLANDISILNRDYALSELSSQIEAANVSHGLLVQAANNFEDTEWMLLNAKQNDWIIGVVGWLPLTDPEATEKSIVEKYGRNPYFKGVRHLIHTEADPNWLIQDNVIESLKILEKYQLTYDVVGINDHHLKAAITVAEHIPGLKMVLDHLNQPPIAAQEKFGSWGELMKEAATHPNIFCKISGLGGTVAPSKLSEVDLKPYLEYTLELFGEERCFCGGDWPVSLLNTSYPETWHIYQQILTALLTKEAQEKVFWKNAESFYL